MPTSVSNFQQHGTYRVHGAVTVRIKQHTPPCLNGAAVVTGTYRSNYSLPSVVCLWCCCYLIPIPYARTFTAVQQGCLG